MLVYARYDLTFPVDLSKDLVREFAARRIPHHVVRLPCGHYSTGKAPFKFADGWILTTVHGEAEQRDGRLVFVIRVTEGYISSVRLDGDIGEAGELAQEILQHLIKAAGVIDK